MKQLIELNLPHDPKQLIYFTQIRDRTPDNAIIVEIGSYVGAIANQFIGGNRKVFSIDPWTEENVYKKTDVQYSLIQDAIDKRGGMDGIYETWMKNAGDDLFINIFPIKGKSNQIAPYFNLPIDLLYLDGDHSYDAVKEDINFWFPKVKKGGIIAGDDYGGQFWGVAKAVSELITNHQVIGNQWIAIK